MVSLAFLRRKSHLETIVHNPKASKGAEVAPDCTPYMQSLLSAESIMGMNKDKHRNIWTVPELNLWTFSLANFPLLSFSGGMWLKASQAFYSWSWSLRHIKGAVSRADL